MIWFPSGSTRRFAPISNWRGAGEAPAREQGELWRSARRAFPTRHRGTRRVAATIGAAFMKSGRASTMGMTRIRPLRLPW